MVAVTSFALRRTVSGRYVHAIGSNPSIGALILAAVALDRWQGRRR